MAEAIGVHLSNWKKYESGQARPTAEVLKKMAVALHVSVDFLLSGDQERGPDHDRVLQFEAVNQFSEEEKFVVRELLEGLILKHEARRWQNGLQNESVNEARAGSVTSTHGPLITNNSSEELIMADANLNARTPATERFVTIQQSQASSATGTSHITCAPTRRCFGESSLQDDGSSTPGSLRGIA